MTRSEASRRSRAGVNGGPESAPVTFTHGTRRRGDDDSIGFSGRSATALGESVALMHGNVSGEAIGHVDFLTGSSIAAADKCARNSVTAMGFRATTRTLSSMRG